MKRNRVMYVFWGLFMVHVMHGNPESVPPSVSASESSDMVVIDMHKHVGAEQMKRLDPPVRTSSASPLAIKVGFAGLVVTATTLAICVHLY